jgi:hypothetical protein
MFKGKALGGSLTGFFQTKKKDWLVKHSSKGYKVNEKYIDTIREVLSEAEVLD